MSEQATLWSRRHRWRFLVGGPLVLGLLVVTLLVFLQPAFSQGNEQKVRICHRTNSEKNPYNSIEPAIANNGDLQGGHLNHTGPVFPAPDWGDIIPPYTYVDKNGDTQVYPGYNWSPEGQAIWENGCEQVAPTKPLTPTLECVERGPNGGFLAHFGYDNPNSKAVTPAENTFSPPPENRGQPTEFPPDERVTDAFQVQSTVPVTWTLTGNQVTASRDSPRCQASITVVKKLNPSDDPGRFALQIDGQTAGGAKAVGDGGTTGTIAVDSGRHTIGEAAAPGTDLADYDIEIVCRNGDEVVAQGTGRTVSVTVPKDASVTCAITNTRKQDPPGPDHKPVLPVVECVAFANGVPSVAYWGYRNDNGFAVTIPIGTDNRFAPAPQDRGQPTVFEPGRVTGQFATSLGSASSLTWTLGTKSATAARTSTHCTATVELRKVTVPADDPGVFNLLIQGHLYATGPNGTTTGPVTVGVGEGTASETAGPGTNLADYDSKVDCTRNGKLEVSVSGTKVDGAVANGNVVVCTFTNTRKTPVPPNPNPPQPTPPPPTPSPTPQPPPPGPHVDLAITKTAAPTTVLLGQTITWTVTIKHNSTVAAADVNVVKVNEFSHRSKLLSVTPSQGACAIATRSCNLGRLVPGASATITARTRATRVGTIVNIVRVASEEQETDYLNNTAAAIARVTARAPAGGVGGLLTGSCAQLTAKPRVLQANTTSVVLATALNPFGRPLRGVTVQMRGTGLRQHTTTDSRGIARFSVTPPRHGILVFQRGGRTLAAARSSCRTLLAVLGTTIQKPVTG